MNDTIRKDFRRLCNQKDHLKTIEYLNKVLSECTDELTAGFCYWNISDAYAMLRRPEELYQNHICFVKRIGETEVKFMLWTVSDATQRFTLELGGYADFWKKLYFDAVNGGVYATELECILYEAHNAALSYSPITKTDRMLFETASRGFEELIEVCENRNLVFYKAVYTAHLLRHGAAEINKCEDICEALFEGLAEKPEQSRFAVGEWDGICEQKCKHRMSNVGIVRLVNALIDTGKADRAKKLYDKAISVGLTPNAYILKRLP